MPILTSFRSRRASLLFFTSVLLLALALAVFARQGSSGQVVTLSAADYQPKTAPESIVATFGNALSTAVETASTLPLPTELAGTTVTVRDAQGRELSAPLLFVSPTQINHLIPAEAAPGAAEIIVRAGNGVTSTGRIEIALVAPAIFTANQDGGGVPAAGVLRLRTGGEQESETPSSFVDGQFIARPIDLGPEDERVFLVLFLSGLRGAPETDGNAENGSAESVSVIVGGVPQMPLFAGAQGSFAGLDQVNVEIPRELLDADHPGSKQIGISIKVPGYSDSNEVEILLAPPAAPALAVTGFNAPAQLLANSEIQIQGSGLAPQAASNRVSFGEGTGDVRPGEVRSATDSQVSVIVPFGAVSGRIALNSNGRRWTSDEQLTVRTSFSAQIKDTDSQPLSSVLGARVCTPNCAAGNPSTSVQSGGWFVLPDPPPGGRRIFTIEPPATGGAIPFNRTTVAAPILSGRDNHLPQEIYLQTIYGPSGTVGAGSSPGAQSAASSAQSAARIAQSGAEARQAAPPPLDLAIEGYRFTLAGDAVATFPGGARSGTLTLTPVKNSLTPVPMPPNVFSSSIVQISPFGVRLEPGGKLTFPNRDGFGGGPLPTLYKYDLESASFIDTGIRVTLGTDGSFVTPEGAITETSIYFIAVRRDSTTIVGRVLDADGRTPVRGAVVQARGQQTTSDGNGGYILQGVPVGEGAENLAQAKRGAQRATRSRAAEDLIITSSYLRPSGKTDTAKITVSEVDVGGVTRVPPLLLPPASSNRPPVIYAPGFLTLYVDETIDVQVAIDDPDPNQSIAAATVSGAEFASLTGAGAGSYLLRLAPKAADAGTHQLTIAASDNAGAGASLAITVVVLPLPAASSLAVTTNEDTAVSIALGGTGSGPLTFLIVEGPARGVLSGEPPNVTYTPNENYNGADSFRYQVSDGTVTSAAATVSITINPVNDPPQLVISCNRSTIVAPGTELACELKAADVDEGQALSFSAQGLPSGAIFDPASARFNWTPGPGQAGSYIVNFSVTDNGTPPLGDQQTLDISIINGRPVITAFQPPVATVSPDTLPLSVIGENFVIGSEVRWNGSARPTMFVSSTELIASIPPSDLAATGTAQVTVFNPQPGGGVSAPVAYSIVNPMPLLDTFLTVTPSFNYLFGESGMILVGVGFLPSSVARWDGVERPTTYISPTQLGFITPIVPLAEALNTHSITVVNPGPGGGVSNPITGFAIANNPPGINFTNPTMVDAGGGDFQIVVTGFGFVPGAVANWNGSPRPTSSVMIVDPGLFTELTVTISAEDIAMSGVGMLTVSNPAPFNTVSEPFPFTINPPPIIGGLGPDSITVHIPGEPAEVLVSGSNFLSDTVVYFDGEPVTTTFLDSMTLSFVRPAFTFNDDAAGTYDVQVANSSPGSVLSSPVTFTILNPGCLINDFDPMSATVGDPGGTLTISGQDFVTGSVVRWNGNNRPTTYLNKNTLEAAIPASDLMSPGLATITVFNPAPGGGESVGVIFEIFGGDFTSIIPRGPAVARLPGGKALLTGGRDETADKSIGPAGRPVNRVEIFDPASGTTRAAAAMRVARAGHTATELASGEILVVGGIGAGGRPEASAEIYDTKTGEWRRASDPRFAHIAHTSTLLADGRVLVAGGVAIVAGRARYTGDAEIYDPATGEWTPVGALATPRAAATAALLEDGRVIIAGGAGESGALASAELFDPQAGEWRRAGEMHLARRGQTMTRLLDGRVLIAGGEAGEAAATLEIYDPATGGWSVDGRLEIARRAHGAVLLDDGRVLLSGGESEEGAVMRECEIYDTRSGRSTPAAGMRERRAGHRAIILQDGRVVALGGYGEKRRR